MNYVGKVYQPSKKLAFLLQELLQNVKAEDFSNALNLAKNGLSISKQEFGNSHPVTANFFRKVAFVHQKMNNFSQAQSYLKESLAIYQKTLGTRHPMVASIYRDISHCWFSLGNTEECLEQISLALEIYESSLGASDPLTIGVKKDIEIITGSQTSSIDEEQAKLAHINYNEAQQHFQSGNYQVAEQKIRLSLEANIKFHGERHPHVALCYKMLGEIIEFTEGFESSIHYLNKSIEISKEFVDDNPGQYVGMLSILGSKYLKAGDEELALNVLNQANGLLHEYRLVGQVHSHVLSNLAALYRNRGDYQSAMKYALKSKDILERMGTNDRDVAVAYSLLGTLSTESNSYVQAEEYLLKALHLKENIFGQEHLEYAFTLANLGTLYVGINDLKKAFEYCSRAQKIANQFLDETHPWMLRMTEQLNRLQLDQEDAIGNYGSVDQLEELRQKYGEKSNVFIEVLSSEAEKQNRLNNLEDCLRLSTELVRLYETHSLTPSHPVLIAFRLMADCQVEKNMLGQAEATYNKLYSILEENNIHTPEHIYFALKGLIKLNLMAGSKKDVTSLFQELISIEDSIFTSFIRATGNEHRVGISQDIEDTLNLLLSSILEGSLTDLSFGYGIVLKRKGLLVEMTLKNFKEDDIVNHPNLKEPVEELQSLNKALSNMIIAPSFRRGSDYFYKEYNRLSARKIDLERRISRIIPFRNIDLSDSNETLSGILSHFSEGKMLIDYVKYRSVIKDDAKEYYACFVISEVNDKSPITFHDLGPSKAIDELITGLRNEIATPPELKDPFTSDLIERKLGNALTDRIFGGIDMEKALNGLTLVPAGLLWQLPFDSLFINKSNRLIDQVTLSYLSNSRDILRFKTFDNHKLSESVVVSSPDFDLSDKDSFMEQEAERTREDLKYFEDNNLGLPVGWGMTVSSDETRFQENEPFIWGDESENDPNVAYFSPLEGTYEEGKEVSSLLNCQHIYGADATLHCIEVLQSPPIFHIASHGFFYDKNHWNEIMGQRQLYGKRISFSDSLTASAFHMSNVLGATNTESLVERNSYQIDAENMLHYSGIALSGINTWFKNTYVQKEAGVGFVSAEYIANMDLNNTQMAVLSACETGLGTIDDLEGVIGLRRSFNISGCQSLVTTLWKIPDQASKDFMTYFYQNLLDGLPKDEALRNAKLTFKDMDMNSYYWGAFTVEGNLSKIN